jgi:hypothetical protein
MKCIIPCKFFFRYWWKISKIRKKKDSGVKCGKSDISFLYTINKGRTLLRGASVSCLVGSGFKSQSIYQINWQTLIIAFVSPSRRAKCILLPPPSTSISLQCAVSSYHLLCIQGVAIVSMEKSFKNIEVLSLLLWDVTQLVVLIPYRRFGTPYMFHLEGSSIWKRPLKIRPMGFPEMSVNTNVHCVTSQKSEDLTPRRKPEFTNIEVDYYQKGLTVKGV